jgi:hypothetical protein
MSIALTLANIVSGMLENASLTIRALARILQEVLANRCQVLLAKSLLFLKFILTVSKATALLFLGVGALLTHEPEAAKLGLYLLFPGALHVSIGVLMAMLVTMAAGVSF